MKKIGIITFHRACNYGAVLQAYALQEALSRKFENDEVEIIDYYCKAVEDRTKPTYMIHDGNAIKNCARFAYQLIPKVIKYYSFQKFRDEYLKLSHERYDSNSVKLLQGKYEIVFAGSDQIWNYESTGFDKNYFLDFCDQRTLKCSYAASFGFQSVFEKYEREILKMTQTFDFISLREKIGVDALSYEQNIVRVNIDPTLLLDVENWRRLEAPPPKHKNYILVYCVLAPKHLLPFVKELSKKTGKQVYAIGNHSSLNQFVQLKHLSVGEFLSWIHNADYIATTSFHGTVFSLLNHKKFVTEYDTIGHYNYRVKHLMELLNIKNREIENPQFEMENAIDWEQVDQCLSEQRKLSDVYFDEVVKKLGDSAL